MKRKQLLPFGFAGQNDRALEPLPELASPGRLTEITRSSWQGIILLKLIAACHRPAHTSLGHSTLIAPRPPRRRD